MAPFGCEQARDKLDALFSGQMRLFDEDGSSKEVFLTHLQSCSGCCRSFDVRVGFSYSRPHLL
jgi:hypothetical protein